MTVRGLIAVSLSLWNTLSRSLSLARSLNLSLSLFLDRRRSDRRSGHQRKHLPPISSRNRSRISPRTHFCRSPFERSRSPPTLADQIDHLSFLILKKMALKTVGIRLFSPENLRSINQLFGPSMLVDGASLGLKDFSQVDMLGLRYKFITF